ncbi:MAG: CAP domain-containing protein, partial [Planctomycetia bacterium]
MKTVFSGCLLIWLSCLPLAVGADPPTGSAFKSADVESFVRYHNTIRSALGVEPVAWSPEIAAYAQKWADRLAAKGDLEHRPIDGEWARIYG